MVAGAAARPYNHGAYDHMQEQHPIDDVHLLAQLKSTFGFDSFRPLQREILHSLLHGQDVFVLMPTGGGKSLCYQLPALLLDGLAVVVSPLVALMKDQVDGLQALGVPTTYVNSLLDPAEIGRRQAAVVRGEVKLLYVAPERLMTPGFLQLLRRQPISYFAIDEAHCISEWGHDFRPAYLELKRLRALFPTTPLGAFTATATHRVQTDIKANLGLQDAASFEGSYNRPNLFYDVRPKKNAYGQLVAYLRERRGSSGIIYCQSRAGTEALAAKLRSDGFGAAAYHAGLEAEERRQRQDAFIRDDVPIIVATIAFGMGIDKPDVRFVVHYDLPKSLESYYQESGRAGRDGEPSDCILFYTYGDVVKQQRFVHEKATLTEREVALRQLRQMADWACSLTCRRRNLLAYFDETLPEQTGPCCDICRLGVQEADCTIPAQMFLSCAKRTGERYGSAHLIQVLRGSHSEKVLRAGHDKVPTFGIGRDRSQQEWQHLARELARAGYVALSEDGFNVVTATERGNAVLFQSERVILSLPAGFTTPASRAQRQGSTATGARSQRPATSAAVPVVARSVAVAPPSSDTLFETLRALRKRLADERGVPPYVIFHDTALRQMASELPASRLEFLHIRGVGERKAAEFGDAFLACIAELRPRGEA